MRTTVPHVWPLVFLLILSAACASSGETEGENGGDDGADRTSVERGLNLAPQSDQIRTVQLYRGEDERNLPVTSLRPSESITLEFDLMEEQGRPLSVYFYHADRSWRRDLSPSQFLESYQNDNLLDYTISQGTAVPYVHYEYRFPNRDIRFRLSGNYIIRVTEKGRKDSVLFERPFFVTEDAGSVQMGTKLVQVPGQFGGSVRPVTRFTPPEELTGDPFGYTTCFIRNGRIPDTRCEDRPLLARQPNLEFELDRNLAFAPATADYSVDLGNLRTGAGILRVDRTVSPFQVALEPDYAQFSGRDLDADLKGQIVIREAVSGRANPEVTAEYVRTAFAFVPPKERPLSERVVVAGSFSQMDPAQGMEMDWIPSRSQYEGEVLLKQGHYQYFYSSSDPVFEREIRQSQSRMQSTFTTFVYYEDPSTGTDRLLRVASFRR